MRKTISSVFIIISLIASAQEQQQGPRTELSISINPMVSMMQSDIRDVKMVSPSFGIDGGLSIDRFFAARYAFSTGLMIGTYGGKLNYANDLTLQATGKEDPTNITAGSDVNYRMQYVSIPMGLKLKTKKIGYLTYVANMGVYTQIRIKAKAESSDDMIQNEDITKEMSAMNFGYQFGLGAEYDMGSGMAFLFGLNFANGLVDVTKISTDKIHLSNLALKLGILF